MHPRHVLYLLLATSFGIGLNIFVEANRVIFLRTLTFSINVISRPSSLIALNHSPIRELRRLKKTFGNMLDISITIHSVSINISLKFRSHKKGNMRSMTVKLTHIKTGTSQEIKLSAENGADALGRIATGKVYFEQPDPKDGKLKHLPFITNREYRVVSLSGMGIEYPEVEGMIL